ncbi:MAG TPA: hypothetical protein VFQ61_13835, partial [Polyangiaceae bacterium]|nr:hypothetical protein [Polyangiaceae bacterium]
MRVSYIRSMGRNLNLGRGGVFGATGLIGLALLSACSQAGEVESPQKATASRALVAAPAIGPEIGTDPPVPMQSNIGYNTVAASDGVGFLSVEVAGPSIRGTRVDAQGNVLDLEWLDFGPGSNPSTNIWAISQSYPHVSFGGGHYLVMWSEYAVDDQNNSESRGIRARLVNPDGTFVGTQNFQVGSGTNMYSPSAVWDGQHFVVTWVGYDSEAQTSGVFVSLLNADGSQVAGSERQATTRGHVTNPRIASRDGHTFLVWEEYGLTPEGFSSGYAIWGTRLSSTGVALDPEGIELSGESTSSTYADVAVGSNDVLVVFQTYDSPYTVRGTLVTHDGQVSKRDFAVSHSTADAANSSVAFDGTDYLVSWADSRGEQYAVYGQKVKPGVGAASDEDVKLAAQSPRTVGPISDHTNVVWNGSRYLVTFLGEGVFGSLLEKDLTAVDDSIPLTAIPNKQGYPVSTWNGQNYVVTWTDERESFSDMAVRAVRIDTLGRNLDPAGIAVSPPENPAFSHSLASTGDGSTLFLWSGVSDGPKQRILSSSGTLGAVTSFGDEQLSTVPLIASDGTNYMAVFSTGDSSNGKIFAQAVSGAGVSSPPFDISPSTVNTAPTIFRGESGYWITYSNAGTWLAPLGSAGQVGTPLQVSTQPVWLGTAGGETNALVVWSELDSKVIRARFLKGSAFSGEPFEIATESLGYGATATWDGSSYWLAWETENHHVMGRNLAEDGTLGEISTWIGEGDCAGVTLTSDRQGQLLLSYVRYTNMSNARRVYSRLIGRDAGTIPNGGSGGAGGGTSTNPGGSGTGANAGASAAGASSGGTLSTSAGASSTGGATTASG